MLGLKNRHESCGQQIVEGGTDRQEPLQRFKLRATNSFTACVSNSLLSPARHFGDFRSDLITWVQLLNLSFNNKNGGYTCLLVENLRSISPIRVLFVACLFFNFHQPRDGARTTKVFPPQIVLRHVWNRSLFYIILLVYCFHGLIFNVRVHENCFSNANRELCNKIQ